MFRVYNIKVYILLSILMLLLCDGIKAAGENCADAWLVNALPYNKADATATTCGAVLDYYPCNNFSSNYRDVVFKYTPPPSVDCISIDLLMEEQFGVYLFVTDNCPNQANVNCVAQTYQDREFNPAIPPVPLLIENINVQAGITYYIIIKDRFNQCSKFNMNITQGTCSPLTEGDNCQYAEPILGLPFTNNATTCDRKKIMNRFTRCVNSKINTQYYYTYTPTANECISVDALASQASLSLHVYEKCPTNNQSNCVGRMSIPFKEEVTGYFSLIANKTYYFVVLYEGILDGCGDFELTIDLVNDDGAICAKAIPIVDSYHHDNDQTTLCKNPDYTLTNTCLKNLGLYHDIVYKYTSLGNECILLNIENASSDGSLFFLDDCPDNSPASCDRYLFTRMDGLNQEIVMTNPGDYYIVIANNSWLTFDFTFLSNMPQDVSDGKDCKYALDVSNASLPIIQNHLSTICKTPLDEVICDKEDKVLNSYFIKYTAEQDFCGTVKLNTIHGYGGFALFSDCPTLSTAICFGLEESQRRVDDLWLEFNFIAGETYYILVYTNSEISYFFDFSISKTFNTEDGCFDCDSKLCEDCYNTGFEAYNFDQWKGNYGRSRTPGQNEGFSQVLNDPWLSRHSIVKSGNYDKVVGPKLKTVSPDGDRLAVKLGNSQTGAEGEQLTYEMVITENNHNFFYNYAVVLEDPSGSHEPDVQPYFSVKILTEDNSAIECANYEVRTSTTDGFFNEVISLENGYSLVFWKDWSLVAVPLKDYIGQTVKIIFTTLDCGLGAHFGYAYIDAFCLVPKIIKSSNQFFCALDTISLIAPEGYKNYVWDSGETTKDIVINQEGYYRVTAYSYSGCITDFDINLTYVSVFDSLDIQDGQLCVDGSISADITDFDDNILSWKWTIDNLTSYVVDAFTHTFNTIGDYDLKVNLITQSGCDFETNKTIYVKQVELEIDSLSKVVCNQGKKGFVKLKAKDGFEPYQYFWDTIPLLNGLITGLDTGLYTFMVMDDVGCSSDISITLIEDTTLQITGNPTNLFCYQDSSGAINLTGSGGSGNLQYSIDSVNFVYNNNFTGLVAGPYQAIVIDSFGCTNSINLMITQPDSIVPSTIDKNLKCYQSSNGSILANAVGGTPPYRFQLNHGASQNFGYFNGLSAGDYTITITDNNNCTHDKQIMITEPDTLSLSLGATDLVCFNNLSGEITANAVGGTTPYSYQWNHGAGQNNGNFIGLPAGNHTITITDINNCTDEKQILITEPDSLSLNIGAINLICFNDYTGEILANANGGTPPYSFQLNRGAGQNNGRFIGLSAGNHTITITDNHNCINEKQILITEPDTLSLTLGATNLLCFNDNTGEITANASGGTTPYSFQLNHGAGQNNGRFIGLPAGNYTITITDINNCTNEKQILITEPDTLSLSLGATNLVCFNDFTGEITANAVGGTTPYSFQLNHGAGQNNGNFIGLPAGNHTITITDINNCTDEKQILITEPDSLSLNLGATNLLCFNDYTGEILANASGGTAPYSFQLNHGAGQNNGRFIGLPAGNHTITITDINNCTNEKQILITEPDTLSLTLGATNLVCFNDFTGEITANAVGGTTPYSFQLNHGAGQNNGNFIGLPAGNHTITLTDINNCTDEKQILITEPDSLSLTLGAINLLCFNDYTGEITANASGGTAPYSFQLNYGASQNNGNFIGIAAGNYTITLTDINNCTNEKQILITEPDTLSLSLEATNLSCISDHSGEILANASGGTAPYSFQLNHGAGQNNGSFVGLATGNHTITITDNNNCTNEKQILITQPDSLILTINATMLLCFQDSSGAISANVVGGTPPYFFQLNNGAIQNTGNFNQLTAQQYYLKVTDAVGCQVANQVLITEPDSLAINLSVSHLSCAVDPDGEIQVNITGGTTPYRYSLDNVNFVGEPLFSSLIAGNHTAYVKDTNACHISQSTTLIAPIPAEFTIERINIAKNDSLICGPKEAFFKLNVISGELVDCLWNFGDGGKNYTCAQQVSHWYYLENVFDVTFTTTDVNGCLLSATLEEVVEMHAQSVADFELNPIQATDMDNYVEVIDQSFFAETQEWTVNSFPWNFSRFLTLDHITTEYTITQITKTKYNCNDIMTKVLPIFPSMMVNIPNSFTPGNDLDNEIFKPIIHNGDLDTYLFEVYDRWGELVFSTHEQDQGWDGTYKGVPAKSDAYMYVVVVKNKDKTKTEVYRDFVNLLR